MRLGIVSILIAVAFTAPGRSVDTVSLDDARIKALADADAKAQRAAIQQLVEVGSAAIESLATVVDRDDPADVKPALQALLGIASRKYTDDQQKEASAQLVAELAGKHTARTRREICRLLGLVGGPACLDPLYKLLVDPDVREAAREALARIPSREATQALVAGLQITEGEFRVGLVNAIGERGDVAAVPILRSIVAGPDEALSRSAMDALSHMPHPVALQTLVQAAEDGTPGAMRALLTLGDTLADAGRRQEALAAFHTAAKLPSLTAAEYCCVLSGVAHFDEPDDLQMLLSAAQEAQKWGPQAARVRGAAIRALADAPGPKTTDFLAEAMTKATGPLKIDLLAVLGKRELSMTAAGAGALAKAASPGNEPAVRLAAIQAIGNARVVGAIQPVLIALREPPGPLRDAAEQTIQQTICVTSGGRDVSHALLAELERKDLPADLRARIMLVLPLGSCADPAVVAALLKATNDADVNVRAAAFKAVGRLCSEEAFDRLLTGIGQSAGPDRDAAEQAMIDLSGDAMNARIRAAYEKAADAQKAALLRILARRNASDIGALLQKEAGNDSAEIRAAAATGLSRMADPQCESTLIQLAEKGPAEVTRSAVTGLLAIAKKLESSQTSRAAGLYTKAFGLAMSQEQTLAALDGLSRTAGPEDIAMLEVVLPMFGESDVPVEVLRASARLAMQLPAEQLEDATAVLSAAATLLGKDAMVPGIVEYLWKIGSTFDPAQLAGYVTCWYLVGPFNLRSSKPAGECHLPLEARPDLAAKVTIDGKEFAFKKVHTSSVNGAVPLAQILGAGDGLAAYGYAEVTVEAATMAQLRIGSDDGIIVWLNGQQVLAVLEDRALTVDQDRVVVELNAGVNRLLAKPLNTFGNWEFSMRLMDPAGEPLTFEQRTE